MKRLKMKSKIYNIIEWFKQALIITLIILLTQYPIGI